MCAPLPDSGLSGSRDGDHDDAHGAQDPSRGDRYDVVCGADQVEGVRKLAALRDVSEPEPRRVLALGEELSKRLGTLRAQAEYSRY